MGYYDELSNGYNKLHEQEQKKKLRIIKNHLNADKKAKLLDVGCGTGIANDIFDCDYTGLDSSTGMLSKFEGNKVIGNAEKMPFENDRFDYVISVTSIHNFKDYESALREMVRVGKKSFVISLLKNSSNFDKISKTIEKIFKVEKIVDESTDKIYFLGKKVE